MVTRRDFIKSMAVSAALVSVGSLPAGCTNAGGGKFKGVCRYCGTGCGVLVNVEKGKVTSVEGDPDCQVNKGKLCMKGITLDKVFDAPDRAKKPKIRTNPKGLDASGEPIEPIWRDATWDEAIKLVVEKYKDAIAINPDSVGYYGSGQNLAEEAYVANKLFKGCIGTNNIDGNPRTCMASAVAGYISSFGKDEPMGTYDDIEDADVFFIIGANMAEAHPILFERVRRRKEADKSVKVIVLDPRRTATAEIADKVVQFVPGTDLALMNSMAYVLIDEGLIDETFIEQHTEFNQLVDGVAQVRSIEEYKAFLEKDYTPEKAEVKTGIAADEIREIARWFGEKGKNTMSLWTMGLNQRAFGTWANNLVHNLHLLTGKICRPGNTPFSLTGQPSACGSIREVGALSHLLPGSRLIANEQHRQQIAKIWNVDVSKIKPAPGRHTINLFNGCATGDIKVLWVVCTNPAHSLPNLNAHHQGMSKVFLVVSEAFESALTAKFADVLLPSAFWMEKEGVYGNGERRTQHIAKAVNPPGEAKPDVWQILEVAKGLGFTENFKHYTDNEAIWEEYRKCGEETFMELASYEALKEAHGITWPVTENQPEGTKIRYAAGHDPYVESGIKFYGRPNGKAVIWFRPQTDPAEMPDDEYPFFLSTGRVIQHWHTRTMTGSVDALDRAYPECYLEMNEDDAQELGVADGDRVQIQSRRGVCTMKAKINGTGRPRPKMVWAAFHDKLSSRLINKVTNDAVDGMSSQPEYKICAVKITKVV